MYARRLTKKELMEDGITEVTRDGHVFRGKDEMPPKINNNGYFVHTIYDRDCNGNIIMIPSEKSVFGYYYKNRTLGLHRIVWAWFNEEVPEGMVVDHINNRHDRFEDYNLDNLQTLTARENIAKERGESTRQIKCPLDCPREKYEEKVKLYEEKYARAKMAGNSKNTHKVRSNLANARARLRYYDAHIEEARALCTDKKEAADDLFKRQAYKHFRAEQMRCFRSDLEILRGQYKEALDAFGPKDSITLERKAKWKNGVKIYNKWLEDHPAISVK